MAAQSAVAMQSVNRGELGQQNSEEMLSQFLQMYDLISRRAFEIYERRGGAPGHEAEDWLRAESDLFNPVPVSIAEVNGHYIVQAEMPGFDRKDIKVGIEPRCLIISGTRGRSENREAQVIRFEWRPDRILRILELPSNVDPSTASVTLRNGILTMNLSRAENPKRMAGNPNYMNRYRVRCG